MTELPLYHSRDKIRYDNDKFKSKDSAFKVILYLIERYSFQLSLFSKKYSHDDF